MNISLNPTQCLNSLITILTYIQCLNGKINASMARSMLQWLNNIINALMAQINHKINYCTKKYNINLHADRAQKKVYLKRKMPDLLIDHLHQLMLKWKCESDYPSKIVHEREDTDKRAFFLSWFSFCQWWCFMLICHYVVFFSKHNYNLSPKVLRPYKTNLKL